MLIDAEQIANLIPHAGRMCLLEGVMAWDAESIRCTAVSHTRADNPLRRRGRLSALCGIEYGAQAMALHGALTAAEGQTQRAGLLASVRDLKCYASTLDAFDNPLLIDAQLLLSEANRVIYAFSVSCDGRPLLAGRNAVVLGPMH